jgi:hypothetical protein
MGAETTQCDNSTALLFLSIDCYRFCWISDYAALSCNSKTKKGIRYLEWTFGDTAKPFRCRKPPCRNYLLGSIQSRYLLKNGCGESLAGFARLCSSAVSGYNISKGNWYRHLRRRIQGINFRSHRECFHFECVSFLSEDNGLSENNSIVLWEYNISVIVVVLLSDLRVGGLAYIASLSVST